MTRITRRNSIYIFFNKCHVEGRKEGKRGRTLEEVALLDAELAYAGTEPEEGEAEDGAEQGHGCRMIGRHSDRW
jgi:hypothetical protein